MMDGWLHVSMAYDNSMDATRALLFCSFWWLLNRGSCHGWEGASLHSVFSSPSR